MKVELWVIGKTTDRLIQEGMEVYTRRIKHYLPFEMVVFPDIKNRKNYREAQLRELEGNLYLRKLHSEDFVIALDELGKEYTSVAFAEEMERWLQRPNRRMIFLIGGAYGLPQKVFRRANARLALSKMTFSHEMVRLFFTEQLYRAMTILRNEPYHH